MTAQMSEWLTFDGQQLEMCSEPLGNYFSVTRNFPQFANTCTALWRGYVGTWEVIDRRLYLVGIMGTYADGQPVTLESIFPGFADRVFAHWFSGRVRVPQGKLMEYVHMGYGSTYEQDLFIDFERGVVTGKFTRVNGTSRIEDCEPGYQVAAFTVFPAPEQKGEES